MTVNVPIKRGTAQRTGLRRPGMSLARFVVQEGLRLLPAQQAWLDSLPQDSLRMVAW